MHMSQSLNETMWSLVNVRLSFVADRRLMKKSSQLTLLTRMHTNRGTINKACGKEGCRLTGSRATGTSGPLALTICGLVPRIVMKGKKRRVARMGQAGLEQESIGLEKSGMCSQQCPDYCNRVLMENTAKCVPVILWLYIFAGT